MQAQVAVPGRITILGARMRFSNGLFKASAPPGTNSSPAYSAKFILAPDHPQLGEIQEKIYLAAQNTFKAQWQQVLAQAVSIGKVCLRPGDLTLTKDGQVYEGCAGNLVLSARNPAAPIVMQADKTRVTAQEQSSIYDGCYVNVQVDIFGYTRGSKGVGARLIAVQYAGEGERLGGGPPADLDAFGEVEPAAQAGSEFGDMFGTQPPQQTPAQLLPPQPQAPTGVVQPQPQTYSPQSSAPKLFG